VSLLTSGNARVALQFARDTVESWRAASNEAVWRRSGAADSVLLLHGLGGTPRVLHPMRNYLRRELARPALDLALGIGFGDIRDVAIPGPLDLVVANPPYVPSISAVPREIEFDPKEAVFAGEDGLDLIPDVIARAAALLRPGGRLGFEHDDSHDVVPLMEKDFEQVERHLDLAGRPRYTTGIRRG